jgi:hypothetical protein
MGFIHESHGAHEISVEKRSESFYIHPAYGYDVECPTCHGEPLMGGVCRECNGTGRVDLFADEPFGVHWREGAHPEFLLEDVPDLVLALADLPTFPEDLREVLQQRGGA